MGVNASSLISSGVKGKSHILEGRKKTLKVDSWQHNLGAEALDYGWAWGLTGGPEVNITSKDSRITGTYKFNIWSTK